MKKIGLICCYLILMTDLPAQKEDFKWIFNFTRIDDVSMFPEFGASILDFNSNPPRFYNNVNITLDFDRTNSVICDQNGEILLYSNGQSIHGREHKPMENGEFINYGVFWDLLTWSNELGIDKPSGFRLSQLISFLPIPTLANHYWVIYQNYEERMQTGYYKLFSALVKSDSIDQEVIFKDSLIYDKILKPGSVHSCQHANGRDWWLLQFNADTVSTFLIDPNGIILDHIQVLDFKISDPSGQSKYSFDGSHFAYFGVDTRTIDGGELLIADFDRCSGNLNNAQFKKVSGLEASTLSSGLEFSSNGNLLYRNDLTRVYQYDMLAQDVFESEVIVEEFDGERCDNAADFEITFGPMQLGPDGKIYIAISSQCYQVHRINFPNKRGVDCDVQQRAITLPTYHIGTVPNHNTLRLGPLDGSSCDTLDIDNLPISRFRYEQDSMDVYEIDFVDLSYYRPETWLWDFDDGYTSADRNPTHLFDKGVYNVCLTVSNEFSEHTSCDSLNIGTTSLTQTDWNSDISIYPNPVESFTRIAIHNYLPIDATIRLRDSAGRFAKSVPLTGSETNIDLSDLMSGVYFYEIMDQGVVIGVGEVIRL